MAAAPIVHSPDGPSLANEQFSASLGLLESTSGSPMKPSWPTAIRRTVRQLGRDSGQREEPADAESVSESEEAADTDESTESVTPEPESGTSEEQSATSAV